MYKIVITITLSLFLYNPIKAQHLTIPAIIIGQDTLATITLPEFIVIAKVKKNRYYERQRQKYNRLTYHVRKALPYAQIAAKKINEIDQKLACTHSEQEKKRIIKEEYQQLMKTFKKPLMKLSITQGKILVRLIYRETNNTAFNHIREYKGSFNAYFWQSIALIFGNNLKAGYEPYGRDKEIENIVLSLKQQKHYPF